MIVLRSFLLLIITAAAVAGLDYLNDTHPAVALVSPPVDHPLTTFVVPLSVYAIIMAGAFFLGYKKEAISVGAFLFLVAGGLIFWIMQSKGYAAMMGDYYLIHDRKAESNAIYEHLAEQEAHAMMPQATDLEQRALRETLMGMFYFGSVKLLKQDASTDVYNQYVCRFTDESSTHLMNALEMYTSGILPKQQQVTLTALDDLNKFTPTNCLTR